VKKNFLITSPPGTGKTTAIKKFIDLTGGKFKVSGFITEEIRDQKGKRVGFKITTLGGKIGEIRVLYNLTSTTASHVKASSFIYHL